MKNYYFNNIGFNKPWDLEFKKIGDKFIGTSAFKDEVNEYANKLLFEFIDEYKKVNEVSIKLLSSNNMPGTSLFTYYDSFSVPNSWKTIKLEELKNKIVKVNYCNGLISSIGICHELITWLMDCRLKMDPKEYYTEWGKPGSPYSAWCK